MAGLQANGTLFAFFGFMPMTLVQPSPVSPTTGPFNGFELDTPLPAASATLQTLARTLAAAGSYAAAGQVDRVNMLLADLRTELNGIDQNVCPSSVNTLINSILVLI